MRWVSASLPCLLAGGPALAYPPPYPIGEILPSPKHAVYAESFLPVYDVKARRPLATVLFGRSPTEELAAKDLAARVGEMAGLDAPALKPVKAGKSLPGGNLICLGAPQTNAAVAALSKRPGLAFAPAPQGEQGYLIRSSREGKRFLCLAGGAGPMGTTFAGQALQQLLKVEEGKVLLRAATVDDWPTFEMRGTCCYTPEDAAWLALARFSTLDMNYGSIPNNGWRDPDGRSVPTGWGRYSGAGSLDTFATKENPHGGRRCVGAAIASYWEGSKERPSQISAALVVGESNGYTGAKALSAAPGVYHLSFWVRGSVPKLDVSVTAWRGRDALPAQRVPVDVTPASLTPTAEWQRFEGRFALPEGLRTFAPQIRVGGAKAEGYRIGDGFWVDDLALTREGPAGNLACNGDAESTGGTYSAKVAALWQWAVPRGLWPMQFVNPLDVTGWEDDGPNKIQVSDPKQVDDLARTFRISLDRGGTWVMLALDDFASRLGGPAPYYVITNEADRKAFRSLGECHGTLVRELYRRLKESHPRCRVIVCPAYYWIPQNRYQEEGEKYLREFGRLVPEDVLILWTGPRVRSRTITHEDVRKFAGLIGRQPYLWDNAIYARHKAPLYLLDPFEPQYPERFWEKTAGGLHNNGGVDEVYKVGCLVYGDYAWNPEAYNPEKSLEKALRMVVGEGCAADAIAFRDHYYAVRDTYPALARGLTDLTRDALAKALGPLTKEQVDAVAGHVEAMDAALARLKERSPNKPLLDALQGYASPLRPCAEALKKHGALN